MISKIAKANIESRKKIAEIAKGMNLVKCELGFEGCLINWPLAPAHRHPRQFYRGDTEKLSDVRQWLCACQVCHEILDRRTEESKKLTEEVFNKLRGNE